MQTKYQISKIILIFIIFNILSCSNSENISYEDDEKNCANISNFGELKVCLPKIEDYVECYKINKIRDYVNSIEIDNVQPLGYYILSSEYSKIDNFQEISKSNFFKICTHKSLINKKINTKEFKDLTMQYDNNFVEVNWEEVKNKVLNKVGKIPINEPKIIESYNTNENVYTSVDITIYENKKYPGLNYLNMIYVKENIFWILYYTNYKNEDSIEKEKNNNNLIIKRFLEVN